MKLIPASCAAFLLGLGLTVPSHAASSAILGWNNLGMHCMDSDYSVFSVLPPYNTIEAQLLVNGRLVTNGAGYTLTYQAVADPSGSFNSTAMGKGNFYEYSAALYGASLAPEHGLRDWGMPGPGNPPQAMLFENTNAPAPGVATPVNWFRAEGIPIAPFDDAHHKNPYPMMRLIAWNSANHPIATNDIVLPVSDEMDCRACHASGTQAAAKPAGGWVWNGLPERDYRLNILRLHDERQFSEHAGEYQAALAARGFNPAGLYRSVTVDAKPILCAACHASEALGAPSFGNIPPLTASVHSFHAQVLDPDLKVTLNDSANRAACYRCHPGSTTRCLRGAMGGAVASDGSMEMQCQSCHGTMSQVGSTNRVGWFMEPVCQSCHSGTATHNSGQIRYDFASVDANGTPRVATDQTFATNPNTPAPGLSLFRFSAGHGGLQCEACHGSTHAEFPSTHRNDNVRNIAMQGHAGVMVECTACHASMPSTASGGPHGLHQLGQAWVGQHADLIESLGGPASCQPCHGVDYRGTVLSRAQADRTLTANFDTGTVTVQLFRGAQVGCYNCHSGPFDANLNGSTPPTVANVSTNTANDKALPLALPTAGVGLTTRVISQPANGTVGMVNGVATYYPNAGFTGADTFTFAAFDGSKNSNLGSVTVDVSQGAISLGLAAHVPPSYPANWPVPAAAVAHVTNYQGSVTFDWDFGDGSPHSSDQYATHAYASAGTYTWSVTATAGGQAITKSGSLVVKGPINLVGTAVAGGALTLTWPLSTADVILESSPTLGPSAQWSWVTNATVASSGFLSVTVPQAESRFLRARRPW